MTIRILIVDDDTGFLDVAAELIAERGFEVLEKATDAAQALATAAQESPDGILLDINLPGRDGSRQRPRSRRSARQPGLCLLPPMPGTCPPRFSGAAAPTRSWPSRNSRRPTWLACSAEVNRVTAEGPPRRGIFRDRDGGPEHRSARGRAGDVQRSAERADPVAQADEAAGLRPGTCPADPVVPHLDDVLASRDFQPYPRAGGLRVLDDVRQRFGTEEVQAALDGRGSLMAGTSISTGMGIWSARARTAGARPCWARTAGCRPAASSRRSSRPRLVSRRAWLRSPWPGAERSPSAARQAGG